MKSMDSFSLSGRAQGLRRMVLKGLLWVLYRRALAQGHEAVLVLRAPGWQSSQGCSFPTEKPMRIEPVRVLQAGPDGLQARLESLGPRARFRIRQQAQQGLGSLPGA